jgi:hypothetical protein
MKRCRPNEFGLAILLDEAPCFKAYLPALSS